MYVLAVLDEIADELGELDDGALLKAAGLDDGVHLGGKHGGLKVEAVGEHHAVPLVGVVRGVHRPQVQHL